jgi:hypothetical protein
MSPVCRAKITPSEYAEFMCFNLGAANIDTDPFTPSWEIIGGYWQWGKVEQAAPGPSGPDAAQSNAGIISGWTTTVAPFGAWSDVSKTVIDPCPAGYRVPTIYHWNAVMAYNTKSSIGTWESGTGTNYSSGAMYGTELMLPAAGSRSDYNGASYDRGSYGTY